MVVIEFYNKGKFLGVFECIQGSSHEDRDRVARNNDILDYDKVVLDNGRMILTRNDSCYTDEGTKEVWNIDNIGLDTEPEKIIDNDLE